MWNCPELSQGSYGRVLTKHFTNLGMILESNELSLLSFLIYQSKIDGSIVFTSALMHKYSQAVKASQKLYNSPKRLKLSLPNTRRCFKTLAAKGLLLHYNHKTYIINPNLTFSKQYVKTTFYRDWCKKYRQQYEINNVDYKSLMNNWIEHVKNNTNKL